MADIGIRIIVIGAGQARAALASTDSAMNKLSKTAKSSEKSFAGFSKKIVNFGSAISGIGMGLTMGLTVPLLGLTAALTGAGIEFQDAFQGVAKTIDGVADPMGNLTAEGEKLKSSLLDMSMIIPVSPAALANLGQLAGQFGESIDTVEIMIDTLAKLQVSTDMVSESQLQAFAQVSKLVGVTADEYNQLGAALVWLGNNFATTESSITSFAQRIAGTTTALEFSASATLAWGAAVTASGITAQTGATALRKAILEMTAAVDEGGESLQTYADLATTAFEKSGMSAEEFSETFGVAMDVLEDGVITAEEFAQIFGDNASGALELFVRGLNGLEATDAIGTLDGLGLGAQRVGATLLNLAGNTDVLRDALSGANTAFEEGTALNEEAAKKFATLKAAIQTGVNALVALGDTITTLLDEDIRAFIDTIKELVTRFINLDEGTQRTILLIAGIAAAIGPVLIVAGGLISVLGTIGTALAAISLPAVGVAAAIAAVGVALFALSQNKQVQKMFSAVASSVKALMNTFKKLKIPDLFKGEIIDNLVDLGMNILPTIGAAFDGLVERAAAFQIGFIQGFKPFVEEMAPRVKEFFTSIGSLIQELTPLLESIGAIFTSVFGETDFTKIASQLGEVAGALAGFVLDAIIANVQTFIDVLRRLVEIATETFTTIGTKIDEFKELAATAFIAIGEALVNIIGEENLAKMREIPEKIAEIFQVLKERAMEKLEELGQRAQEWIDEKIMPLVEDFLAWKDEVVEVFSEWGADIMEKIQPVFDDIISAISEWAEEAVAMFQEWVSDVLDWFDQLYEDIVGGSIIPDLINDILEWINTLVTDGVKAFGDFVDGVIEVVSKLGDLIGELIGSALSTIFESLGDGEGLASLFDLDILNQITTGFATLGETITTMRDSFTSLGEAITALFENIGMTIETAIENFTALATTISVDIPAGIAVVSTAIVALSAQLAALVPVIAAIGASFITQFVLPATAGITQFSATFQGQFNALRAFFKSIVDLMVGHWLEFTAATLSATQELKSELDSIFTRLEKDNVVKFKTMGKEFTMVVQQMLTDIDPLEGAILKIQDSTEAVAGSFGSLGDAANAALSEVEAAAEAMCAAMEEAEDCITGSPELRIQHPFERFSKFMKETSPQIQSELSNMFEPAVLATELAAANPVPTVSTINNITEDNSVSVEGVPLAGDVDGFGDQLIDIMRSERS